MIFYVLEVHEIATFKYIFCDEMKIQGVVAPKVWL